MAILDDETRLEDQPRIEQYDLLDQDIDGETDQMKLNSPTC